MIRFHKLFQSVWFSTAGGSKNYLCAAWDSSMRICGSRGSNAIDMLKSREMTEKIGWQAKQPLKAACVSISEALKCWGAWDNTCVHKTRGERHRKRKHSKPSTSKRSNMAFTTQTTPGAVSKATLRKTSGRWGRDTWAFLGTHLPPWAEMNWTEQAWDHSASNACQGKT